MVALHFLEHILSIVGSLVVFRRDKHCAVQVLANDERITGRSRNCGECLLVGCPGHRLVWLLSSNIQSPVLLKIPGRHTLAMGGHAVGKRTEEVNVRSVAIG